MFNLFEHIGQILCTVLAIVLLAPMINAQNEPDTIGTFQLIEQANSSVQRYNIPDALALIDSAKTIYLRALNPNAKSLIKCFETEAFAQIRFANYIEGSKAALEAIRLRKYNNLISTPQAGSIYFNLAITSIEAKDYEKADSYLSKAVAHFALDSVILEENKARLMSEYGILYRKQKKSDEAINFYLSSLEANIARGDTLGIAKNYHNLGNVYYDKGDLAIARRYYVLAKDNYKPEQMFMSSLAHEGIALTYRKERIYDIAIDHLNIALNFLKESVGPEHRYTKKIVRKIAQNYIFKGEHQRAIDLLKGEGAQKSVISLETMAGAQLAVGNIAESDKVIKQCLKSGSSYLDSIFSLKIYGDILVNQKRFDLAEAVYKKSLEFRVKRFKPHHEKIQLLHLALAKLDFARGEQQRAIQTIDSLLASGKSLHIELVNGEKVRSALWDQLMRNKCLMMYDAYIKSKSKRLLKEIFNHGTAYFESIDTLRSNASVAGSTLALSSTPTDIVEILLSLIYDEYRESPSDEKVAQSIKIMDEVRDLLWIELVQLQDASDMSAHSIESLEKENSVRKEIASLELLSQFKPDSIALQNRIVKLKEGLLKSSIAQHKQKYYTRSTQSLLDRLTSQNESTLAYFISDGYMYRSFVSSDTCILDRRLWQQNEEKTVELFLTALRTKSQHVNNEVAAISELLIGKIPVNSKPNLRIFPDASLHQVPFEILYQSNGRPLMTETAVAYNSSLKRHFAKKEAQKYNTELIGFAPSYEDWHPKEVDTLQNSVLASIVRGGLMDLPSAKQEIENISEYFRSESFIGADATVNNFVNLAESSKIVHLSMHALADKKYSQFSRLVFSATNKNNILSRYYFASEIAEQRFPAEMVVLSACNTGTGSFVRGDGVLSLARAFEYAGAKSTVFSLWKIPDASTKEIMTSFYRNLKNGLAKHEALRQAKLQYMTLHEGSDLAHPYYWSGFVVSGDVDPISTKGQYRGLMVILGLTASLILMLIYRRMRGQSNR